MKSPNQGISCSCGAKSADSAILVWNINNNFFGKKWSFPQKISVAILEMELVDNNTSYEGSILMVMNATSESQTLARNVTGVAIDDCSQRIMLRHIMLIWVRFVVKCIFWFWSGLWNFSPELVFETSELITPENFIWHLCQIAHNLSEHFHWFKAKTKPWWYMNRSKESFV